MSNVYSHRFIASHAGASASYTCPAGYVAVLRGVTLFGAGIVYQTGHLIHADSDCTIVQWVLAPTEATAVGAQVVIIDMRFVFYAGETIFTADDSTVDLTASGFLLTLP